MPLAPGTMLGPYEILSAIGSGGMGEVWKARDTRLNRIVAIKRVKTAHAARFEQEARAIAALNHPHICQIYDVGPDYLVMEFIDGAPLRGPLPAEEALRVAIQIASALEEAHARGIIHRDLKPGNILITTKGPKLLDFGLAKITGDQDATLTMAVSGTPLYMSPEQAEGKALDARSDIFSFGAVVYEMLAGRRAFSTLGAVLRDEPAAIPSLLGEIAAKCLRKSPAQRYQSMAEVRAALAEVRLKPADEKPSIAVLPFANMSRDPDDEYFSDGLAEEIINALAQNPGLKVIARTSSFAFRGKEQDITKIAETLRVGTILEGSVRRSGSRVRITAQLITASDGSHLWSQRYDREMADVFEVQDEVAAAIASVLQVKLSVQPALRRHTPKPEAYEAFLKGRYYQWKISPENVARSREFYEQAMELDPRFALGYVGLADHYLFLAAGYLQPAQAVMPRIRTLAQKALELDPELPEAHAMLGIVAGFYDLDWKEAERRFRLATAREPVPPLVSAWHVTFYLRMVGRAADAVEESRRALKQDPLNVLFQQTLANTLAAAGRLAEAEAELRQALALDPNFAPVYASLSANAAAQGRFDDALAHAEQACALMAPLAITFGALAGLLKRKGEIARSNESLRKIQQSQDYARLPALAFFHLTCGELDQAADWMEKAIEQRVFPALMVLPLTRVLFPHPCWAAVAKKANLPEF